MAFNEDEFLAAVSGGVDAAATPPTTVQETPANEPDDTDLDTDANGGPDETGDGGDETNSEPSGEPTGDLDADGEGKPDPSKDSGVDKDGKPVAKAAKTEDDGIDPATGQPYTPEALAAKKAEEDKEAFKKAQIEDPINAPIPKYLKETTQKRMTALVGIAKELTTKYDTAMKDRNEIIGMITDTGANAQQYRGVLNYLSLVNSGEPAKIQQAISVMQKELEILSRAAGIPVAGVDHLAEHTDLISEVAAGKLTAERAQEIAVGRNRTKFHQQRQTEYTQTTEQQQAQAQAEHAQGVADLNKIGKQLEKAEGAGYRAKATAVLASIKDEMAKVPPREWAQMFLVAYTTYRPPVAAAPARRAAATVPKNQPLRGNNPSGGQQKAPASLEEAINFGIAAGTRR